MRALIIKITEQAIEQLNLSKNRLPITVDCVFTEVPNDVFGASVQYANYGRIVSEGYKSDDEMKKEAIEIISDLEKRHSNRVIRPVFQ